MPDMILLAVKSTAVLSAASLVAVLLRRGPAASRHLVWTLAFGALLLLPFLSVTLPPLPAPDPGLRFTVDVGQTVAPAAADAAASGVASRVRWETILPLLWFTGSALSLLRLLMSGVSLWRVRRKAHALGVEDGTLVLAAPPGSMPMTAGLLRPAIFLPADAEEWDDARRRAVLLHELAHVRRHDVATHLLGRLALAVYWWHPLAWLAWRRFLLERERAADDMVLASGECASDYAAHLLDLARSPLSGPGIAMVRPSDLERRVRSILAGDARRSQPGRAAVAASTLAALLLAVPLAALQNGAPPATPAWVKEAAAALTQKDYETAARHITSGSGPAQILMWKAILSRNTAKDDEALALFKQALDAGRSPSLDTAVAARLYAKLLRAKGREEEARQADAVVDAFYTSYQAPPRPPDKAVRIGGSVTQPRIIHKVEPNYSVEARAAKLDGTVVIRLTIGAGGAVSNAWVTRPLGLGLDEEALAAVNQWKFEPGLRDGTPVDVQANVEINFRLL